MIVLSNKKQNLVALLMVSISMILLQLIELYQLKPSGDMRIISGIMDVNKKYKTPSIEVKSENGEIGICKFSNCRNRLTIQKIGHPVKAKIDSNNIIFEISIDGGTIYGNTDITKERERLFNTITIYIFIISACIFLYKG